jgi:ferric-dicitrate binding protein FerR (iron transport regulator)
VATFIQWINAREEHHQALAAFYAARFRPEFKPAFGAWLATRPSPNRAAPLTTLLGLGWLIFLGTVVWLATLPLQLRT